MSENCLLLNKGFLMTVRLCSGIHSTFIHSLRFRINLKPSNYNNAIKHQYSGIVCTQQFVTAS